MKTSRFQLIVYGVFILCIIVGVIAFATYRGGGSSAQSISITIWGTFPKSVFDDYVSKVNNSLPQQMTIKYIQEAPASFRGDFVSALARGVGPDAILIPADMLLPEENKLTPIPYTAMSEAAFKSEYVDDSFIYLSPDGVVAMPFTIDPMVMYWNRDMFNSAGVAVPPSRWNDFDNLVKAVTVKDQSGTITRSAIAMGDFTNVDNARELLGTLFLQAGNPVTVRDAAGAVSSAINPNTKPDPVPALQFFTKFVDPTNPDYSWNRSWPDSKTAFLAGSLATYFGFASELADIKAKNPNLNFDVAPMPQLTSGGQAATYGKLYGFSISRSSQNQNAAFQAISSLTDPQYLPLISAAMYLPSVSRAVIAAGSSDPYMTMFDKAALIAESWLDPDPSQSGAIFGNMVQAVTSGQKSIPQAISDAGSQLNAALNQASNQ